MATTLPAPGPQQPITDDTARMLVFDQIIGSDIQPGQPDTSVWNGDWHQALKTASARWTPTRRQRITIRARRLHHTRADIRAAIYLLHAGLSLTAGIGAGLATAPYLPTVPVIDANAAWFTGEFTAIAACAALGPAVDKLLRALRIQPAH